MTEYGLHPWVSLAAMPQNPFWFSHFYCSIQLNFSAQLLSSTLSSSLLAHYPELHSKTYHQKFKKQTGTKSDPELDLMNT